MKFEGATTGVRGTSSVQRSYKPSKTTPQEYDPKKDFRASFGLSGVGSESYENVAMGNTPEGTVGGHYA